MITDQLPTVYRLASPAHYENCHTCLVKMPTTDSFLDEITKYKGNRQYISAGTSGNLPNAPLWKGLPHTAYVMLLLKENAPKDAEPIIKVEEPGQLPREALNREHFEILGHTVIMLNEWNNAIITKYVIYTATDTASDNTFNKTSKRINDSTHRELAFDYQKKLAADLLNLNKDIFYALLYPLPYAGYREVAKELITQNPIPHIKSHLEAEILAKQKDSVFENEKKAVEDLLNEFCERQNYSDEEKKEFFKLFLLNCYLGETSLYADWIKSLTQSPYSDKFFDYICADKFLKLTFQGGYNLSFNYRILGTRITQALSTAINDPIFISLIEKWKSINFSEIDIIEQVSLAGWLLFEYRSMPDFIDLLITPTDNKAKYTKKIGMIREFANSFYDEFSIPLPENLVRLIQNDTLKESGEIYSLIGFFKLIAKLIGFQKFQAWLSNSEKFKMMLEFRKNEQINSLLRSLREFNFTSAINEKIIILILRFEIHIYSITSPNNTIIELRQLLLGLNPEAKDIDLYAKELRSYSNFLCGLESQNLPPNTINIILYLINLSLIKVSIPSSQHHSLFSTRYFNKPYQRYHTDRDIHHRDFLLRENHLPILQKILSVWYGWGQGTAEEIDMLYEVIKITSQMPADLNKPVLSCEFYSASIDKWRSEEDKLKLVRLVDLKKFYSYLKKNNIRITSVIIRTILNADELKLNKELYSKTTDGNKVAEFYIQFFMNFNHFIRPYLSPNEFEIAFNRSLQIPQENLHLFFAILKEISFQICDQISFVSAKSENNQEAITNLKAQWKDLLSDIILNPTLIPSVKKKIDELDSIDPDNDYLKEIRENLLDQQIADEEPYMLAFCETDKVLKIFYPLIRGTEYQNPFVATNEMFTEYLLSDKPLDEFIESKLLALEAPATAPTSARW